LANRGGLFLYPINRECEKKKSQTILPGRVDHEEASGATVILQCSYRAYLSVELA